MTIQEFLADRRKQPFLIPISRKNYIVASIGIRCIKPRSIAAIGIMHACSLDIKNKLEAVVGKPICEFHILGAAETFVETAGGKNVVPSKRGVASVKLPRRRRPISPQQCPVLLHQHLLLPADPGSHLEALRREQGP